MIDDLTWLEFRCETLRVENEELRAKISVLKAERDALCAKNEELSAKNQSALDTAVEEYTRAEKLDWQVNTLRAERDALRALLREVALTCDDMPEFILARIYAAIDAAREAGK